MEQSLKDRMYNYEEMPPQGVWEAIAMELDGDTRSESAPVIELPKKNKIRYIVAAAAAAAVIIFCIFFFRNSSTSTSGTDQKFALTDSLTKKSEDIAMQKDQQLPADKEIFMTVPEKHIKKEESTTKTDPKGPSKKDDKVKTDEENADDVKESEKSTYITISGPEGQQVKVSSKVTALMESSDDPAKPVWNKKVKEWKNQMQSNTLAPTPGNFLDIVELTKSLRDK